MFKFGNIQQFLSSRVMNWLSIFVSIWIFISQKENHFGNRIHHLMSFFIEWKLFFLRTINNLKKWPQYKQHLHFCYNQTAKNVIFREILIIFHDFLAFLRQWKALTDTPYPCPQVKNIRKGPYLGQSRHLKTHIHQSLPLHKL